MADISKEDLIHAGLPWSNPLKITVKADLYISLLVINRGLLNLLSNEYYLDLKALRINQYLDGVIDPHISDGNIHWTEGDIKKLFNNWITPSEGGSSGASDGGTSTNPDGTTTIDTTGVSYTYGLTQNTTFIIPVWDNNTTYSQLKLLLNQCPKNLNGHTLTFAFTIPYSKIENIKPEGAPEAAKFALSMLLSSHPSSDVITPYYYPDFYSSYSNLNLSGNNISFDSFYGGTLLVVGNDRFFFNDKDDKGNINYKSMFSALSKKETRLFYEYIQQLIVDYSKFNKIIFKIKGNGKNTNFSTLSFKDCQTDTYLYKLNVLLNSSIKSQEGSTIVENLPYYNDFAIFYPNAIANSGVVSIYPQDLNELYFESYTQDLMRINGHSTILSAYDAYNKINYGIISGNYLHFDTISSSTDENAVDVSGELKRASNKMRQVIYNKYIQNNQIKYDTTTGAALMFWMKRKFDSNTEISSPIYSDRKNLFGEGLYIGLDKIEKFGTLEKHIATNYSVLTTNPSIYSNVWCLWRINFDRSDNVSDFKISIDVISKNDSNSIINLADVNVCTLSNINLNTLSNLCMFGYKDSKSTPEQTIINSINAGVRNILFFNKKITDALFKKIFTLGFCEYYNWNEKAIVDPEVINQNALYGSLYVYNTSMLNVINCSLIGG